MVYPAELGAEIARDMGAFWTKGLPCDTKAFDYKVLNAEEERLATQQLAVCEGSDWFWWFGDYNSSQSVSDFEQLFRRQLKSLYKLLHLPEPSILDIPISAGGGEGVENAGTMRRNQ